MAARSVLDRRVSGGQHRTRPKANHRLNVPCRGCGCLSRTDMSKKEDRQLVNLLFSVLLTEFGSIGLVN